MLSIISVIIHVKWAFFDIKWRCFVFQLLAFLIHISSVKVDLDSSNFEVYKLYDTWALSYCWNAIQRYICRTITPFGFINTIILSRYSVEMVGSKTTPKTRINMYKTMLFYATTKNWQYLQMSIIIQFTNYSLPQHAFQLLVFKL